MAKVLIVEDDQDIRESVRDILVGCGHEVMEAEDVVNACDLIPYNFFDLIISDYKMPLLSGLDLLSYLNDRQINVPVIWLSGQIDPTAFRKAWKIGLFEFIEKPFSPEAIKMAVEKALVFGKTLNCG